MSSRRDIRAALVLGLLLAPIAASSAQQVCLTATPTAKNAITNFLQNTNEAAWRQAHGISATSAEQLQPLADAADAALCRAMDSTIAESPTYYLRAGSLIIGTTAQPVERTPGVIGGHDLGHDVFVFDSTGRWIHSPGEDAVAPPPDLRATTAIAGNVALQWTNRGVVTSYLVKRAAGTGAYATLATIAGTATSYVDATAASGTYRYQLIATGTSGSTTASNEVSVTVADPGTLVRSATGLLFRDDFNRPNGPPGADWLAESGSWQIVDGRLQTIAVNAVNTVIRLVPLTARRDFHVQVNTSRSLLGSYASVWVRRTPSQFYQADLGSSWDAVRANVPRLYRNNGWWGLLGFGTFQSVPDTTYRMTYSVIDKSHRTWVNSVQQLSVLEPAASDLAAAGGFAFNTYGQVSGSVVRFDNLVLCSGRRVTITGLPAGYRLRVAGLVSDAAVAGVATSLDLFGSPLPVAQLEILDPSGAAVKTLAPADGVWGGDSYTLTSP